MQSYYTDERNTQMMIYLMKAHGIRKIVASPGTTNVCLVASLQQDPFFEIISSVDERSAAYMACGMAAESGEPVVLSCTGATASRNYIPGLTEAFYRKLPILAITSTQHMGRIGHHMPQVIDRTNPLRDIAMKSVHIPTIQSEEDEWAYGVQINDALLELKRHGGGPVHIDLTTTYSSDFSVKELPVTKVIKRVMGGDIFPRIMAKRVGIYVGAHTKWEQELTDAVDLFCEKYNGIVFCDHTSNYQGKYCIFPNLVLNQEQYASSLKNVELMIHIGEVSGAYTSIKPKEVWRVNMDGEVRDTFRKLTCVFEMNEKDFFNKYVNMAEGKKTCSYFNDFLNEYRNIYSKISDLPFSNIWVAQNSFGKLPKNSVLHLGILNTLRSWNFFEKDKSIMAYANTGGFGIDGGISSLIGASLVEPKKLYFGIFGDLAFFYDLNSIGNRHVSNNIRLMVINNGRGIEFRNYNHPAAKFGDDADLFMAAAGHYGNKSPQLLRHYAEDLGFIYMSASNKDDFKRCSDEFFSEEERTAPILLEVFTNSKDESDALYIMNNLEVSTIGVAKNAVKDILGDKGIKAVKKIIKG